MRRSPSLSRRTRRPVAAGLLGPALALAVAGAFGKTPAASEDVVVACERSARQSLLAKNAQAADVAFEPAPLLQEGLSNDRQLVLRGSGRFRAGASTRTFSYSCNVDARTAIVVGMVLRDSAPAPAAAAPTRAPAEPDLRFLSPAACESRAALALKQRWPRVSQINFDSETRRVQQKSASRAELHGYGRAMPAPGEPATHFGFDCEVDTRDGLVIGVRLTG